MTVYYKVCATVNYASGPKTIWFNRTFEGAPKVELNSLVFAKFTAEEVLALDIEGYQKSCRWECCAKQFDAIKIIKVTTTVTEEVIKEMKV